MGGDFSEATKQTLAKRAGERCSLCGTGTSKPHTEIDNFINLGEAAHIRGNKKGTHNRFDEAMTDDERSDISNAIWLCTACHKKIDTDDQKYTLAFLASTKKEHEQKVENGYYDKKFPDFNEQSALSHDKDIFIESEKFMNEEDLNSFLKKLESSKFIYFDDAELKKLNNYLEFHNLESKKYLNDTLNVQFSNLRFSINGLLLRLYGVDEKDKRYDAHLMYAHIGEPFFVGMKPPPDFSFSVLFRSGRSYYLYLSKFNTYSSQIKKHIEAIRKSYQKYRQLVKATLYV
jgi:hypothetical protein